MLAFEQPTPRAIAAHIVGKMEAAAPHAAARATPLAARRPAAASAGAGRCRLLGTASRWPGSGSARRGRGQLLLAAGGAVNEATPRRWTLLEEPAGVDWSPYAGLVPGIERLDAPLFRLAPVEVDAMDPQQRCLLETGYEALHEDGCRRASLVGSDIAVHVGIDHLDWQTLQQRRRHATSRARASAYSGTGEHANIASGRLSFVLGLCGASTNTNTACSSALVALHSGVSAMRGMECGGALVLGARAILLPFPFGTLHARDGRSKSFDALADGYLRSEGVGAAHLRGDGPAAAAIGGCSVRAGGRSASLTAPNGSALGAAVRIALRRAAAPQENRRRVRHDVLAVKAEVLGIGAVDRLAVQSSCPCPPRGYGR